MTNTAYTLRGLVRLVYIFALLSPVGATADVFPDAMPLEDIDATRTFQSELKGAPDRYTFTLHAQQTFYANLLIPEMSGARKDFLVEVISERGARYAMDGAYFLKWTSFAGPDGKPYLKGPEIAPSLYPGNYILSVSNKDNHGIYVLVVSNEPGGPDIPQKSAPTALFFARTTPVAIAVTGLFTFIAVGVIVRRRSQRKG